MYKKIDIKYSEYKKIPNTKYKKYEYELPLKRIKGKGIYYSHFKEEYYKKAINDAISPYKSNKDKYDWCKWWYFERLEESISFENDVKKTLEKKGWISKSKKEYDLSYKTDLLMKKGGKYLFIQTKNFPPQKIDLNEKSTFNIDLYFKMESLRKKLNLSKKNCIFQKIHNDWVNERLVFLSFL